MSIKKAIVSSLAFFLIIFSSGCKANMPTNNQATNFNDEIIEKGDDFFNGSLGDNMNLTKAQSLFNSYFSNIADIPVSFTYNNAHYKGFKGFRIVSREVIKNESNSTLVLKLLNSDEILSATIEATMYNKYDAFDWTVYLENTGSTNSGIIEDLLASELTIKGDNPVLKNNYGDYGKSFTPATYELNKDELVIKSNKGRSSEDYMPYFNIENDGGGVMMAIGWSGTWQASFAKTDEGTKIKTESCLGLRTYLKPGEKIRTARMVFVVYEQRDEDLATNKWRKWAINCNMPHDIDDKPVQPASIVGFVSDTEYGWYRGGSGDENSKTWRNTYNLLKEHNLKFDYHWFDAGWYYSSSGETLAGNDWWPVGSWTIDNVKWPGYSLNDYMTTVKQDLAPKGSVMWFEIERFYGDYNNMRRWGADPKWYLAESGNCYLLNLGNKDAREWIFNKIVVALTRSGATIFRQDHNFSPAPSFAVGDLLEGPNRQGITENLHFQGEYELWQRIINWQVDNGGPAFIEGQSAGGNRQDIETLKYMAPFYRTDSDITYDPPFTVSKINALNKWIPFGGPLFGQYAGSSSTNGRSKFQWRSTYSSALCLCLQFQNMDDETWDLVEWGEEEFNKYKAYTYYDFYELTPWKPLHDDDKWVSRMYFNSQEDKGVLEVFNFKNTNENKTVVRLKGLNPNHYYSLVDPDGINGISLISGRTLMEDGYEVYLQPNSSALLWVEPKQI